MNGATHSLTATIVEENMGSSHPGFVSIPFFEEQFGQVCNASHAVAVGYLPLVVKQSLNEWNSYTSSNQGWIEESVVGTGVEDSVLSSIWDFPQQSNRSKDCGIDDPELNTRVPVKTTQGPFAPVWTIYPLAPSLINKDLHASSELDVGLSAVKTLGQPLILESCTLGRWFSDSLEDHYSEVVIVSPVFESFAASKDTVGYLIEVLSWKTFWKEAAPQGTKPCILHLESSCGQQLTYRVSAAEVELLSRGEAYDGGYQDMVVSGSFSEFTNSPDLVDEQGLPSICVYTINIFPTQAIEDEFISRHPLWFTLGVVGLYLLTTALFLAFDIVVTRQRDAVELEARKQSALVSSLFPKSIQAKMLQDAEETRMNKKVGKGKAGIKDFLNGNDLTADLGGRGAKKPATAADKSKPIADLFPESK